VTKPTTIKAITEIPANTPRPIGKTCSFLPGKTNGAAEELAAFSAAAVAVVESEEVGDGSDPSAEIATAPVDVTEVLSAAELAVTAGEVLAEGVAEAAAERVTEVVPTTETPGLPVATAATGADGIAEATAADVELAPTTKVEEAVTATEAAAVDTVGDTITEQACTCCT